MTEREIKSNGETTPWNYMTNKVNNRKYSFISMLPLFLFNEYKQFSNLYFLCIALLQIIPSIRVGFLITYIGPLVFVLTLSFLKEVMDEIRRMKKDRFINEQKYQKID